MDVVVFGKHVEVPAELKETAQSKVVRIGKFASDIRRVEVDFGETKNPSVADHHTCEILVHVTGALVKGHASAAEQLTAFDRALDRVEEQLRRRHDKRAGHNHDHRQDHH